MKGSEFEPELINPIKVKQMSEMYIRNHGGDVPDNIPPLASFYSRYRQQVIERALVMNALLNIYFKAPTTVIHDWLGQHNLLEALTEDELGLLHKKNSELSEKELTNLYWYIESLWALFWVMNLHDDLAIDAHVPDYMIKLVPDLRKNEGPEKFSNVEMRTDKQIYEMLDLYYRLHWFTSYCKTENIDCSPIGHDFVFERRKALFWVMHPEQEWHNVDMRFFYRQTEESQ